jgi:tRNA pseudouridine55 synthase
MGLKQRVILYKKKGETPLECIKRYKLPDGGTYAGRLDPMAEGLLIVLFGDEKKHKEKYLKLDKEYELEVLFGFATDSYDILGKITSSGLHNFVSRDLQKILKSFVGKFSQKYPAYSSRYFEKAKSGELKREEIQSKNVEIKSIKYLGQRNISKKSLKKFILNSIKLVKGDFRQNQIIKIWKKELVTSKVKMFPIIKIKVKCSSGTYMRSLANNIGEKVGVSALALSIKRTKIGEFK